MKNADQPISPMESDDDILFGLTKREYFAAQALQGLLCSPLLAQGSRPFEIVNTAVVLADALLKRLEDETDNKA